MNFSDAPTSNLYKFSTIIGIVFVIAGTGICARAELLHREAYINEKRNFIEMEHMASLMVFDVQQLLERKSNGVDSVNQIKDVHNKVKKLSTLTKDHLVAAENIAFLYDDFNRAKIFMLFSWLVGILVSGFGLYKWLTTTQKNEDIKQLIEIEKAKEAS